MSVVEIGIRKQEEPKHNSHSNYSRITFLLRYEKSGSDIPSGRDIPFGLCEDGRILSNWIHAGIPIEAYTKIESARRAADVLKTRVEATYKNSVVTIDESSFN